MAKSKKPTGGNSKPSGTGAAKADAVASDAKAVASKAADTAKATTAKADAVAKSATQSATDKVADKAAKVTEAVSKDAKAADAKPDTKQDAKPAAAAKDAVASNTPKTAAAKADKPKVEAKAEAVKETAPKDTPTKSEPPKTQPQLAPVQAAPEQRSVFLPLVLGGLIAGGIGFAAAEYNWFSTRTQDDGLASTVSAQAERITALESVEPVEPQADPAIETLTADVATLNESVGGLSDTLDGIEARLVVVEQKPAEDGSPSAVAQAAELNALKTSVEEQRSEIEDLLNNARSVEEATAEAARKVDVQAALTKITTALAEGQPFGDATATIADTGTEVPAALGDVAESGVVTLSNLQTRFPDAARAALSVARASGGDDAEPGLGGFLKRQLGARSTVPREGDDPDAVLSRAEAAVRDGALDGALGELDALPENVQSEMQDWLDDARARNAAQQAAQDLSQSLTAN